MIIKWKTNNWCKTLIDRVECTRETDKCVWIAYKAFPGEVRCLKITNQEIFHDTWEDARSYILEQAKLKIQEQQDIYDKVVKMEKPKE